jgi:hypothetical protein
VRLVLSTGCATLAISISNSTDPSFKHHTAFQAQRHLLSGSFWYFQPIFMLMRTQNTSATWNTTRIARDIFEGRRMPQYSLWSFKWTCWGPFRFLEWVLLLFFNTPCPRTWAVRENDAFVQENCNSAITSHVRQYSTLTKCYLLCILRQPHFRSYLEIRVSNGDIRSRFRTPDENAWSLRDIRHSPDILGGVDTI